MPANGSVLSSPPRYSLRTPRCELQILNKQQVQSACSLERSFVNNDLLSFFYGGFVRFKRFAELEGIFPT